VEKEEKKKKKKEEERGTETEKREKMIKDSS
jgi:hypothetical protein